MAKKEVSFYPGCSSQTGASSSNMMRATQTMCDELDIQLNEIPDWNCCGASIGYGGGGELPRLALSARNIALSEQHNPGKRLSLPAQLAGSPPVKLKSVCMKIRTCSAMPIPHS